MEKALQAHINKIVQINQEEFEVILSYFKKRSYSKHQYLVQSGDLVPYEYFVLRGLLKSSHLDKDGKRHILQFAMEDWWITDMEAFYKGSPATLDIDCLEDTEVLYISHRDKEKLCAVFGKMEHFFRIKNNAGNIALQKRVLMLVSTSALERYEQLIHQYPLLHQRVSKTLIASYLGVTREALSRLTSSHSK